MVFFHEFTFNGNCALLVCTEDNLDRFLKCYQNDNYKLVTLWQVTDITVLDCVKYHKIKIVN